MQDSCICSTAGVLKTVLCSVENWFPAKHQMIFLMPDHTNDILESLTHVQSWPQQQRVFDTKENEDKVLFSLLVALFGKFDSTDANKMNKQILQLVIYILVQCAHRLRCHKMSHPCFRLAEAAAFGDKCHQNTHQLNCKHQPHKTLPKALQHPKATFSHRRMWGQFCELRPCVLVWKRNDRALLYGCLFLTIFEEISVKRASL